jgi:hypothetical protein
MNNDRGRFLVASAAPGAAGLSGTTEFSYLATRRACRRRKVHSFDIIGVQPIVA